MGKYHKWRTPYGLPFTDFPERCKNGKQDKAFSLEEAIGLFSLTVKSIKERKS